MSIYLWEKEIKAGGLKLWEKDIIAVYLWEKKIRPDEYKYQVNANTLFYCPFDTTDFKNLANNTTLGKRYWSPTINPSYPIDKNNPASKATVCLTQGTIFDLWLTNYQYDYTLSVWMGVTVFAQRQWLFCTNPCWIWQWRRIELSDANAWSIWIMPYYYTGNVWGIANVQVGWKRINHFAITQNKMYINWVLVRTISTSSANLPNDWTLFTIGWHAANSSCSAQAYSNMILREYIIENRSWSAQEIQDYYNNTKTLFYQN